MQTPHYSATTGVLQKSLVGGVGDVRVYPIGASFVDDGHGKAPQDRGFVNVWNSGTKEYNKTIGESMRKIPFQKILDAIVRHNLGSDSMTAASKTRRGNLQFNYGIASGLSLQPRNSRNREVVLRNYGAAIPNVRTGTLDNLDLMEDLSSVAKDIGVCFATTEFLLGNPKCRAEIDFVQELTSRENFWGLISIIANPLDPMEVKHTKKHCDDQNGIGVMTQVMTASKILRDSIHGK